MSVAATLADLSFPELLHLIAFNQRSARLVLTGRGRAVFVFWRGRLIYAASTATILSFSSHMLETGLLREDVLERVARGAEQDTVQVEIVRLLLQAWASATPAARDGLRDVAIQVVADTLQWPTGSFRLEPIEDAAAREGCSTGGLDPQEVLLHATTRLDSAGLMPVGLEPDGPAHALSLPPEWDMLPQGAPLVGSVIGVQSANTPAEVLLALLRCAARGLNRGALFGIYGDGAVSLGLFGGARDVSWMQNEARRWRIPLDAPSLIADVARLGSCYRGELPYGFWNDRIVRLLGGGSSGEVAALPVVVEGRVRYVFLGDNHWTAEPIPSLRGFEFLMAEAGLALERLALWAADRERAPDGVGQAQEGEEHPDAG